MYQSVSLEIRIMFSALQKYSHTLIQGGTYFILILLQDDSKTLSIISSFLPMIFVPYSTKNAMILQSFQGSQNKAKICFKNIRSQYTIGELPGNTNLILRRTLGYINNKSKVRFSRKVVCMIECRIEIPINAIQDKSGKI